MSASFKLSTKEALAFEDILAVPAVPLLTAGASYAGLDASSCPTAADMDTYFAAGFRVACAYLANRPGRIGGGANHSWINAVSGLSGKGWGLAPTYVGAQASKKGAWQPTDPLNQAPVSTLR